MAEAAEFRSGQVAIVGRPNVGKSTLLNHLVGQKLSITSRKPQTTRHNIRGIVSTVRAQTVFVDTPGFQSGSLNALGSAMNRSVAGSLADVDAIVLVIVAGRYLEDDQHVVAQLPKDKALIVALNKVDRMHDRESLLAQIKVLAERLPARAYVPVCARSGYQVPELLQEIEDALPQRAPLYPEDQLTDRDERFFAAEYIREQLFRTLGDELPYATTVNIDRFEERGTLRRIHATILVGKASHRAIVIGEQGARLKAIASAARRALEKLYSGKVYLQVWVKVRRGWADDPAEIKRLGYG